MENQEKSHQETIKSAYFDFLKTENERPKNMYLFAQKINLSEPDIYKEFASFEAIEATLFTDYFNQTVAGIEIDRKTDNKAYLSEFYHAFFNLLTENRTLVKLILHGNQNQLQALKTLRQLRKSYLELIASINLQTVFTSHENISEFIDKSVAEISWTQLLFTLKFWLKDESANFTKTHEWIDKSMKTGFDILNTSPIDGLMNLGKFFFSETAKSN